jgi:hypothetical protein
LACFGLFFGREGFLFIHDTALRENAFDYKIWVSFSFFFHLPLVPFPGSFISRDVIGWTF